jgi:GTPase SAR1 family protein
MTICVWDLPAPDVTGANVAKYTNAKVLIVGDSGVGKSGLALRLTANLFEPTVSSESVWATHMRLPHDQWTSDVDREIWLWDFAGQADYRLIHQLFMDETALAVLVFNPQSDSPFEGLAVWHHDLERASRRFFKKLLIAARCDRGGLVISHDRIRKFAEEYSFEAYLETSAMTGMGCEELRNAIVQAIDWSSIPYVASPHLFRRLKDEILKLRDQQFVLLRLSELKQQLELRWSIDQEGASFTIEELRAVIGLLAGPGIVWQLEFGSFILLQPERINSYAAAVIRSVRAHSDEYGSIAEEDVLAGRLRYDDMQRLPPGEEEIVLRAMHQIFIERNLCLREHTERGTLLVFPSYFRRDLTDDLGHPPILVTYRFGGHASEIYATLVVQLHHTRAFDSGQMWRNAASFKSHDGHRMGLVISRMLQGQGEISVYFDSGVTEDTKVTFIKYVHEHLLNRARDVERLRHYVCPHCGHPVKDSELARQLLLDDGTDAQIRCQQRRCDALIPLWDLIEQKFASDEFRLRVSELAMLAKATLDNESLELILLGHAYAICGEAGQIFRMTSNSDWGIDGEIEFKDLNGLPSGSRLYLQLKSGDSYLYKRDRDAAEVFYIKNPRWSQYWCSQKYPVMLVIRTSDGVIRWMNVTDYLNHQSGITGSPVTQIIFSGEPFTARNLLNAVTKNLLLPNPVNS